VTLILGMSKPEGIYLSVDYRVTDARTGKLIDDATTKNLNIYYPPFDSGPKVLMAFTGLAKLPDGTPMMDWIRGTLRGETEVVDQSMAHLLARLDRDIARFRVPLIINILVLEENNRRHFGGFTNQRFTSDRSSTVTTPHFAYTMQELGGPFMFANGFAAARALADGHAAGLEPHLSVIPRDPANHMKLLAIVNRAVAKREPSVSPFCKVSFINADTRFGPTSQAFVERGESVPFEIPTIVCGVDLTYMTRLIHEQSAALFEDRTPPEDPDPDAMNRELRRRE
jgi:hypothetical protein